MAQYNDNTFDMRTASLMSRLYSYFDDASMGDDREAGQLEPLFKFHSLILIADIYEHVRLFMVNRERILSEYFSERTIKQCLQNVVKIEELQKRLPQLCEVLATSEASNDWDTQMAEMGGVEVMSGIDEFRILHRNGINALCENYTGEGMERPSVTKSVLWKAPRYPHEEKNYTFGKVFRKANEDIDEELADVISPDPDDRVYNHARTHNKLSNRVACQAESIYWIFFPHSKENKKSKSFDFLDYIISIKRKADEAKPEDIYAELRKALELLRNVFMTDAEDIYYVRTGDFAKLGDVYSEEVINHFYTELPFKQYYKAKAEFVEWLTDQMDVDLEDWRINRGYIGRKLSPEEKEEFYQERKDTVIENMKSYKELWRLRMHSGGLDADVTPENFARMFYRRKGVDIYFIHLQWELEELNSIIEKNKTLAAKETYKPTQSPQQKAVADFVDNIIMLANEAYEKWNNQRVSPAVHKPEVLIVIKKEELIKHMQDKMENDFDALLDLCYPETSKSKQMFCQYVVKLQKEEYFGALPNKMLAKILAPIVKLGEGTVTNYLSQ